MQIGVDLGGTKIEVCVIDSASEVLWRQRVGTPRHSAEAVVQAIADLVARAAASLQLAADCPVGIGTPGSISPSTGLLRGSNTTVLNGLPLLTLLEQAMARPVVMANDANCFALAEAVAGAGRAFDSVFGVILGTGVGGGLVWRGQLLGGAQGIGGEWGHNRLAADGVLAAAPRDCFCGGRNCNEVWLSGPALTRSFQQAGVVCDALPEAIAQWQQGNPQAEHVWQQYLHQLAFALAQVVNVFDPACIVLGGGVSNCPGLAQAVVAHLPQYVFSDHCTTQVRVAQLGDSAGVIGAAWLTGAP